MRNGIILPKGLDLFLRRTRENMPLLLLGGLFVCGAVCGTGIYRTMSEDTANTLMFLLSGSGTAEGGFRFWADWGAVFLTNLLMVAVLFLCGFCAVSQPVVVLVPFVKGLGFGLAAAYNVALLSPFSAFFWLKFLPGAFLATTLALMCARQSLLLSVYVYQSVFSPQPKGPRPGRSLPALYGMKYVTFAVVCAVFSLIDVLFDLVYEVVSAL